jgi:Iap family predicted aminopeptidase
MTNGHLWPRPGGAEGGSPWLILLANDLTLIILFVRALLSETLVLGRLHQREVSAWRERAERAEASRAWTAMTGRGGDRCG